MLFLSDLSRQECHRYTTVNQDSTLQLLGWVTDEIVYADTSYCFSADTREFAPPECADVSDNACTAQSTRKGSLDPNFNKYTEHQIRSSHGSRARRNETRVSYCSCTRRDKPGLHTVCVRKPSNFALLRVRGPNRRIDSDGSTCVDTNLFLAEFTKRGRCDNQESGTQHQQRIQHDTTRDVTPDEER